MRPTTALLLALLTLLTLASCSGTSYLSKRYGAKHFAQKKDVIVGDSKGNSKSTNASQKEIDAKTPSPKRVKVSTHNVSAPGARALLKTDKKLIKQKEVLSNIWSSFNFPSPVKNHKQEEETEEEFDFEKSALLSFMSLTFSILALSMLAALVAAVDLFASAGFAFLFAVLGFAFSITAIIFGILGIIKSDMKGLAIAGMIIGLITLVAPFFVIIALAFGGL